MRRTLAFLFVASILLACTSTSFDYQDVKPPPKKYTAVIVGEIEAADAKVENLVAYFRAALIEQLRKEEGLGTVIDDAKATLDANAFVVVGKLTEMDLGSAAARIIIGFGAGSQELKGQFEMRSHDGATLAKYSSSESYAGGAGIGGFGSIALEELAQKFGTSTGAAMARWARGEPLDQSSEQ